MLNLRSRPLNAVADYQVNDFAITGFPQNVAPGDAIFVDVAGTVVDIYAGMPDFWQICVAAAVVDDSGRPTNLKAFKAMGSTFPWDNTMIITDLQNIFNPHVHLVPGTMPEKSIKVVVQLFANHSNSPVWTWDQWQYANGPLPSDGWDFLAQLKTDTEINNPPNPTNWLLIGGVVAAFAAVVTVVTLVKK